MRFFIKPEDISTERIALGSDELKHIRVARLRPDEEFVICDGEGTDYICRLDMPDSALVCRTRPSQGEPRVDYSVFAALAKGDKLDSVVQKSVELGAREIILFNSVNCVSIPDEKALNKKLLRLQRISLEAAKQSGRGIVPEVSFAGGFDDAVRCAASFDLPLFLYELEDNVSIKSALQNCDSFDSVAAVSGPEGGFSIKEAEFAVDSGLIPVSLGPRILRCETAPICALTAVMYHSGAFG